MVLLLLLLLLLCLYHPPPNPGPTCIYPYVNTLYCPKLYIYSSYADMALTCNRYIYMYNADMAFTSLTDTSVYGSNVVIVVYHTDTLLHFINHE